jgi:hypothetical protein
MSLPLETFPESYKEALAHAERRKMELLQEIDAEMAKLHAFRDPTFDAFPSTPGESLNNLRLVVTEIDLKKGVCELDDKVISMFEKWEGLRSQILAFQIACHTCLLAKTEEDFPFLKKNRQARR